MTRKTAARAGAAFFAVPAALMMAAGPALAAEGDVVVTNTETVQAYLNASGRLDVARVYEQVAMNGKGSVALSNPVETNGLRNLDGFGGFEVKDGNVVGTYEVDGEERLRTVSDYTRSLPLDVDVRYTLDGREVKPGDVVGESGLLKVQYTVRNVTGKPQEVSFDDGTGTSVTATEDVVIPMVGSLSTVLPSNFTDVRSAEANMAGDGRGGTKMSFTMTLFGPIGKPEATFGYEAQITDGVVPKASISALPVSPLDSPSFKGGAASYKGGAETGATLTAGATEIDANLLKLRDGAGELLAGLIQLRDGANQLNAGLSGEAAPGARKLSDGAGQLKDGTGKLAAGAGKAKAGSSELSDGADRLAVGSGDLAAGAAELAAGVAMIQAGVESLPGTVAEDPDFKRLKGALAGIQAGIGKPTDVGETTLLGGLNLLQYGLRSPVGVSKCDQDGSTPSPADDCGAADGAQLISERLRAADPKLASLIKAAQGTYQVVDQAVPNCPSLTATGMPAIPEAFFDAPSGPCYAAASVILGLAAPKGSDALGLPDGGLKAQTELAAVKLEAIFQGLDAKAIPGLAKLKKGLYNDKCDPMVTVKSDARYCGVSQAAGLISAGVDELVNGIAAEVGDVLAQASSGADEVAGGAGLVAGGAGQVADGAGQLDSGLGELSSGARQLDSGAGQLRDGAGQLADGLGEAADGSGKIAEGLGKAADGAPKLEDGAQRLSDEGTKKLVAAGKSTAADYGQKYALIEAGAQRAKTEGMAYGAPADAAGTTAYSFELAGMSGEGGRNMGRTAGAAAIFGLAGAAALLRRRFV